MLSFTGSLVLENPVENRVNRRLERASVPVNMSVGGNKKKLENPAKSWNGIENPLKRILGNPRDDNNKLVSSLYSDMCVESGSSSTTCLSSCSSCSTSSLGRSEVENLTDSLSRLALFRSLSKECNHFRLILKTSI